MGGAPEVRFFPAAAYSMVCDGGCGGATRGTARRTSRCTAQLWQHKEFMPNAIRRERLLGVLKKITPQTLPDDDEESLFESGLLDSFALPDLVSALEQEFAIKIPDRDLNPRKFDSIARIEAYLDERISA